MQPTQLESVRYCPACRPNVVLQIKNYMVPNAAEGRQRARSDIPFLFKVLPGSFLCTQRWRLAGCLLQPLPLLQDAAAVHAFHCWCCSFSRPSLERSCCLCFATIIHMWLFLLFGAGV